MFTLIGILFILNVGCSSPITSNTYPASSTIIVKYKPYPDASSMPGMPSLSPLPAPSHGAPEPLPGKASISGVLYSLTLRYVLGNTLFYLTPAVGNDSRQIPSLLTGPDEKKGDLRGYTNIHGQFALDNVLPGNYYLIVGVPYNWIPAVLSEVDETPLLIKLTSGQRKLLGIVYIPWP